MSMRADQLLLQRQIASSRSQAQRLITSGVRWRLADPVAVGVAGAWKRIAKNSDDVPADAEIELLDDSEARYVSRGGLKLEGALTASRVAVAGKTCLDVGQSTGGFTDCLLQAGAAYVVGVDVGSGQLHPSLRDDSRVQVFENVNARDVDAINKVAIHAQLVRDNGHFDTENDPANDPEAGPDGEPEGGAPDSAPMAFDLIVGDLSFISQTLVLPALLPLLKPGGDLLMLVKPQFELQPGQVGKGGIVKDAALYAVVEKRIRESCQSLGLTVQNWFDSPITGGDGNREFFVHATAGAEKP